MFRSKVSFFKGTLKNLKVQSIRANFFSVLSQHVFCSPSFGFPGIRSWRFLGFPLVFSCFACWFSYFICCQVCFISVFLLVIPVVAVVVLVAACCDVLFHILPAFHVETLSPEMDALGPRRSRKADFKVYRTWWCTRASVEGERRCCFQ